MNWQDVTLFLAAWTAISVPFGMLIGKAIAIADQHDERMKQHFAQQSARPMLAAPPKALPSPWADAYELSPVRSSQTA